MGGNSDIRISGGRINFAVTNSLNWKGGRRRGGELRYILACIACTPPPERCAATPEIWVIEFQLLNFLQRQPCLASADFDSFESLSGEKVKSPRN